MADVPDNPAPGKVVLSVFFSGTTSAAYERTTQIELFGELTQATDLTQHMDQLDEALAVEGEVHLKMRFDGCGVARGMLGVVFASGLSEQCDEVVALVHRLINDYNRNVTINVLGLSRGGVAGCMLAKKLDKEAKKHRWIHYEEPVSSMPSLFASASPSSAAQKDEDDDAIVNRPQPRLVCHLLLFDPVPGNFVTTGRLDFFGLSSAWANMNLTSVNVVRRALLLYPYEPLPALAVHAPMIPIFPPGIATYDVILGCHQGAVWNHGGRQTNDTLLSAALIRNFFISFGTRLETTALDRSFHTCDSHLLNLLEGEVQRTPASTRSTHSYGSMTILARPQHGEHLNKAHYILSSLGDKVKDSWTRQSFYYDEAVPGDLRTILSFNKTPQ